MRTAFLGCFLLLTLMVTQQGLQEFKQIFKEKFGIELSDQEVLDKAERFLMMIKVIYRQIPKDSPFLSKGGAYAPTKTRR